MKRVFASALSVISITFVIAAQAQGPSDAPRPLIVEFMPQVADLEKAVHFYNELLGIQALPPAGEPRARLQWYNTRPFLQDMYGVGGQLRNFLVQAPNFNVQSEPLQIQALQWRDAKGKALNPRLQDPGAARLILTVSNVDLLANRLKKGGARAVTAGGAPVAIADAAGTGRAIAFDDGNGFFVELIQPATLPVVGPGDAPVPYILGGDLEVTVADLDKSARFFREVLGLSVTTDASFHAEAKRLELFGLKGGQYREANIAWPDKTPQLRLIQFMGVDQKTLAPLVPDPNSTIIRLFVRDMDSTLAKVKAFPEAKIMNVSGGPTPRADRTPWLIVKLPGSSTYLQMVGLATGRVQ